MQNAECRIGTDQALDTRLFHSRHAIIHGVSYHTLSDILPENRRRFSYHRGTLEVMDRTLGHEGIKCLMATMLTVIRLEMQLGMLSGGSMPLCNEKEERGLEPDECYWIQNAAVMRRQMLFDPD